MSGTLNYGALQGLPNTPYVDNRTFIGTDQFFQLAFLDHNGVLVVPTALSYIIDDISNAVNMVPTTVISTGLASTMSVQVAAVKWQMTYPTQGSQLCQVKWTFSALDSVSGLSFSATAVTIVELIAIATTS